MPLRINDNTKLPILKVESDNLEVQPAQFVWKGSMYDHIGIEYSIFRVQFNFDPSKRFDFDNWDVDFLYAFDMKPRRFPNPIFISMMLQEEMPKTWDITEIMKWADAHTAFAIGKCTKIR
jgi:hypothetical protein